MWNLSHYSRVHSRKLWSDLAAAAAAELIYNSVLWIMDEDGLRRLLCVSPQLTVWMLRGLKSNSASRKILNTVHFSIKLSWKSYSSYSISAGCSFSELCRRRIVFCLQTFVLWSLREGKAAGCLTWRLGLFGRRWCNLHLSMSECSVWNLLHRSFSLGKNNTR